MTDIDPTHPNYPQQEREEHQTPSWRPRTDVLETNDEYILHLEIPGVTRDDVHLKQHDGMLHVYGVRRENFEQTARITCQECPRGPFSRPIPLPSGVNTDETSASFDQGVLTIRVPKAVESKPRSIPVS